MLQKSISFFVWLMLLISTLGGVSSLYRIFGAAPETAVSYEAEKAVAEQVARSYLTYDPTLIQQKKEQLSMYPEDWVKDLVIHTDPVQNVLNVSALDPVVLSGNRIKIPVDTWVLVSKQKISNPQDVELTTRHLQVTVFMSKEGEQSTILGLPVIEPVAEKEASKSESLGQSVNPEERSVIEPVLKAFLTDYYSASDPLALQNLLADKTTIYPLGGKFIFQELKSSELFFLGEDQYFAVCHVVVKDPVLDVPLLTQMRIGLVKSQDNKFFVNSINEG